MAIRAQGTRVLGVLRGPTGTTTLTNLLIVGSNAIGGIASARALGPAGRGQLTVVMLWSAVINVVGILGLPSACTYYAARWPERRAALVRFFTRAAAGQALAATAVSAALLWWLRVRLHLPAILTVEYMTWAAGAEIGLYGMCYAQGISNFRYVNLIRAVSTAAPTIPLLALVILVRLTPSEAGAAYVVPNWIGAAIGYGLLRRSRDTGHIPAVTGPERRSIFSYSRRSLASFSSLALNANADQMIIGILVPVGSLGLYSVAASASSPLPSFVTSISAVGLPAVAALNGRAQAAATWKTLGRALLPLAVLAPACALALPWLIPALYGPRYTAAIIPAELLLIGTAFTALTVVADDLLRAHGHPGFVSITQGAGAAVTIVGALLLARRSLDAVAVFSSLGFVVAFLLAAVRLRVITRPEGRHGSPRARHAAGPVGARQRSRNLIGS
jgi:O-antigen/teichoic acid export membrane protein